MIIPDGEVFKTMQKVAMMEPLVERVAEFIDNGELNRRIEESVARGIKSCPHYINGKVKKRTRGIIRYIFTILIPAVTALIVVYFTTGLK